MERDAEGDLLAALILSGGEMLLGTDGCLKLASEISERDPEAAKTISGHLVRGEEVPAEVAERAEGPRQRRS